MKITITFDSLEEFAAHIKYPEGFEDPAIGAGYDNYLEPSKFEAAKAAVEKIAADAAQEAEKEAPPFELDKNPPKAEKAEEKPAKAPTIDIVTVRKALSELNAKAGTNVAGRILKAAGYGKLTEVPAEKLPEIMAAAKEQMDE